MNNNHHAKLASSEIFALWNTYVNETMALCVLKYFLETVEDPEISEVLKNAKSFSEENIKMVKDIFKAENFPVPQGFTDEDVNINAPKLFSDEFMLYYAHLVGNVTANVDVSMTFCSVRKDLREFFTTCINSSIGIYNQSMDVLLSKGIYPRSPAIPIPEHIEMIQKKSFLSGWFGEQRPLSVNEITMLYYNNWRNAVGYALSTGFSQVTSSKQARDYFVHGAEIANHVMDVTRKFMDESNLIISGLTNIMPTNSTTSPFSDKLLTYHIAALGGIGIGYYGMSIGLSARRDIGVAYSRLMIETMEYSQQGYSIMIENEWIEQPPLAPDRKKLSEK
ncbi:DUF3231 family protein [Cytobacillus horneckiae]|uniref:DUF3231 family protein n=1 Tax=Cytobacillus horneckiae TaxID=549687 RepID=UPI0039A2441D